MLHWRKFDNAVEGPMGKIKWLVIGFFLIEIAAFAIVGKYLGVLFALLLVVLTTLAGLAVLREQGLASAYQSIQMMQGGRPLDPESMPNPVKMIAGLLMVIPGFVTDSIGFILLCPLFRRWIEKRMVRSGVIFDARVMGGAANEPTSTATASSISRGDTIEGEFERK